MFFANVRPNVPFSKEAIGVFYQSLDVSLKGIGGIFIAMLIFYVLIIILSKTSKKRKN